LFVHNIIPIWTINASHHKKVYFEYYEIDLFYRRLNMEDYLSYPFYYYNNDDENESEYPFDPYMEPKTYPVINLSKGFENGLSPYESIGYTNDETDSLISAYPIEPVIPKIPLPDAPEPVDRHIKNDDDVAPLPRFIPFTMDTMNDMYDGKGNYMDDMYSIDMMNNMGSIKNAANIHQGLSIDSYSSAKSRSISNNPEKVEISVYKELDGHKNSGSHTGKSDVLYTSTYGMWTFTVPKEILRLKPRKTEVVIKAVLDDHRSISTSRYAADIVVNEVSVHSGRLALQHGSPSKGPFRNWSRLTFPVRNLSIRNRVVIRNTSSTRKNDWIAFNWMELRIYK